MSDIQFGRLCNALTWLWVFITLLTAAATIGMIRAKSVKKYVERARQDEILKKEAAEDYIFKFQVAIALWLACLVIGGFRLWAYIVHGV